MTFSIGDDLDFNVLQGAITKRMTAIEEMAGMDVLCSDKTGTLTLNKLTVDKNLIEVKSQNLSCSVIFKIYSYAYLFLLWLRFLQKALTKILLF